VSGGNRSAESRSRGSVLAELLILTGLALLAFFWIIPSQVSGGGLGLDPGFLPRLCAAAIGLLVLADGVLRLVRNVHVESYPEGWAALVRVGSLAVLGAVILQFAGLAVASLVTIPIGMLMLGERRPLLIALTTLLVAGLLFLFQR
jgi:uncharacterized membrane protein HdeD (DUF308 family)